MTATVPRNNVFTANVVIAGAGAAGLMCAIEAGRRGRSAIVLERNATPGRKIRISGGGRCNFTNLYTTPANFISENPGFFKSALARYQPDDFIRMVERRGIRYHEKKLGQLFCDRSSEDILALLLQECADAGAQIVTDCAIESVRKDERFALITNRGVFRCDSLVVATGGLSIPQLGATGFGYDLARQFGIRVTTLRPALVPLLLEGPEAERLHELSGVSIDAEVRCGKTAFREKLLFTHRGLSGPAALQISSYWQPGAPIEIDILPESGAEAPLPKRFLQTWNALFAPAKPRAQWSRQEAEDYRRRQHHWTLLPSGTEGYAKAEVTAGGIDTTELSSRTMESRRVPGLYFIGEVVDVTGQLGGFNFQWAWASGFAAGQAV